MKSSTFVIALTLALAAGTACDLQRKSSTTAPSELPAAAAVPGSMIGVWTSSTSSALPPGLPTTV